MELAISGVEQQSKGLRKLINLPSDFKYTSVGNSFLIFGRGNELQLVQTATKR